MRWLGLTGKLALVCLAAACGGNDSDGSAGPGGGGGGGVAGTYQLVGANGAALPAVVHSAACGPSQMVQGNLRLSADGRSEMRFDRIEQDGQRTGPAGPWSGDWYPSHRSGSTSPTSRRWSARGPSGRSDAVRVADALTPRWPR